MKVAESLLIVGIIYYFFESLPYLAIFFLGLLLVREILFDFSYELCQFPHQVLVPDRDLPERDESKKTCVVTGAAGFVGSFVVELLLKEGRYDLIKAVDLKKPTFTDPRVENICADITSHDQVNKFCEGVDTVFHVAGLVSLRGTHHRMNKLEQVNVKGVQNIVNGCIRKKVKNLIHLSSASAGFDGTPATTPLNEKTKPIVPTNGYAITKLDGERRVLSANNTCGLKTVALRPCAIYGEKSLVMDGNAKKLPALAKPGVVQRSHIYAGHVAEWMRLADIKLTEVRDRKEENVSGRSYYIGENYFNTSVDHDKAVNEALGFTVPYTYLSDFACKVICTLVQFIDWFTCGALNILALELNHGYYLYAFKDFVVEDNFARKVFGFKETITVEEIKKNIGDYYSNKKTK